MKVWRCRSADVRVWRCRSADVRVWRCRSADVMVWRCRSADVKVWRCRSANVRVWRCRSADVKVWRCRSADVKVWRCRSADVRVWRCITTAAFYEEPFAGALGKNHWFSKIIAVPTQWDPHWIGLRKNRQRRPWFSNQIYGFQMQSVRLSNLGHQHICWFVLTYPRHKWGCVQSLYLQIHGCIILFLLHMAVLMSKAKFWRHSHALGAFQCNI